MDANEFSCTPPELKNVAIAAIDHLLPEKSKSKYVKEYNTFSKWCEENKVGSITENVLLAYFEIMSRTKKASTMWSNYSMLKTCLSIYKNIDISKFLKLLAFLKRQNQHYQPKKSCILESEEINRFINEADDNIFLAMKVILIVGYCGACRRDELTHMSFNDLQVKEDMVIITVPWINIIKKYIKLRPSHASNTRFFLSYRNGKCTTSPIGINKIGEVPKNIATFLKLPSPEKYTGHCFRRSSASHMANQGGDLLTIKKHGGWKSSTVAEGYVDASLKKRIEIANMFTRQDESEASTSTSSTSVRTDPDDSMVLSSESHPKNSNKIEVERVEGAGVSKQQNIIVSDQSLPPIYISASETSTVTVKIYSHCHISEK